MKIKIEKELFQWEKDRKILIETYPKEPVITIVEFYNADSKVGEAEVLKNNEALIPNQLLKVAKPLTVLACVGEFGNTKPIARKEFRVIPRPCPEGYQQDQPLPEDTIIIYDGGEEIVDQI